MDSIRDRRLEYETAGLDVGDLLPDPIAQWRRWYAQAEEAGCVEPNAMVVSTVVPMASRTAATCWPAR